MENGHFADILKHILVKNQKFFNIFSKMTPIELIQHNISGYIRLEAEEMAFFTSLLETRQIKKRQLLLHEGEICKYSAFITDGCLRGYIFDKNGFERVLSFAPVNWWIADMYSLISQTRCSEYRGAGRYRGSVTFQDRSGKALHTDTQV
ncbi:Crp/Fnr family transcriptional regulator [Pseudarcicella hirudinis]|uniref:Crp/Fnr family transcriptional regulator n=1 Tax=Pseudarcicella hirudinis TaxID=1079859 RepID=UPI0035ED1375